MSEQPTNTNSAFVYLDLADDPRLIEVQARLRAALPKDAGIEWQLPKTFHVTVVYCLDVDDFTLRHVASEVDGWSLNIRGTALGVFENGDERALHLRVEPSEDLGFLQEQVYDAFKSRGLPMSEYSEPSAYTPHITLAYLPVGVEVPKLDIEVDTVTSRLIFGRGEYQPYVTLTLSTQTPSEDDDLTPSVNNPRNEGEEEYDYYEGAPLPKRAAPDPGFSITPEERAMWDAAYGAVLEETGDERKAHLAAWGAVRRELLLQAVGKSVSGGVVVQGWGMLFTDAEARDLDEQFFDGQTKTFLETSGSSLWYEHGQDPLYGVDPIGRRVNTEVFRHGIWTEHELYPDHPQIQRTLREVDAGDLSLSSDSLAHYVYQGYDESTGRLGVWPIAGWSLTKTPAEPGLGPVTFRAFVEAVKSAQAREAQGDTGSDANPTTVVLALAVKERNMDDMVQGLASFLGVDASKETVVKAMEEMVARLQAPDEGDIAEDESMKMDMPDMVQLRVALGLDETAEPGEVIARLQEIVSMMSEEAEPAAKSFNYEALKAVSAKAAATAPAVERTVPYHTEGQKEPGMKTTQYGARQIGRAEKPSLVGMLKDIMAGKSSNYQIGPLGGYIVREEVREDLLPLLRAQLVFEQLGVRVTPMSGYAAMDIPKITAAGNAYWIGQGQTAVEDDAEVGTLKLVPKKIAALTKIPIEMLTKMPAQAESRIRDDLILSMRLKMEYSGLYGTGAVTGSNNGAEPLGLINVSGVTKTTLATNGRAPSPKDMSDAKARVQADNVELDASTHWLYHSNVLNYFEDLTDTTGQLLNRTQWTKGFEPLTTTQIPTNLTTGSSNDTTDIFFGRWNYYEMGVGEEIELRVLQERYIDQGLIGIIGFGYADFVAHYPEAFEVLRGVKI